MTKGTGHSARVADQSGPLWPSLSRLWNQDLKFKHRYVFTFMLTGPQGDALDTDARRELRVEPEIETVEDQFYDTPEWRSHSPNDARHRRLYSVRRVGCRWDVLLQRRNRKKDQQSLRQSKALASELPTLDQSTTASDWSGRWFQKQTTQAGLRPSCRLRFQRTAFDLDLPEGPVRLTMDTGIRWALNATCLMNRTTAPWQTTEFTLFRMKFPAVLPSCFKSLIYDHALLPVRTTAYSECIRLAPQQQGFAESSETGVLPEEVPCRIG